MEYSRVLPICSNNDSNNKQSFMTFPNDDEIKRLQIERESKMVTKQVEEDNQNIQILESYKQHLIGRFVRKEKFPLTVTVLCDRHYSITRMPTILYYQGEFYGKYFTIPWVLFKQILKSEFETCDEETWFHSYSWFEWIFMGKFVYSDYKFYSITLLSRKVNTNNENTIFIGTNTSQESDQDQVEISINNDNDDVV